MRPIDQLTRLLPPPEGLEPSPGEQWAVVQQRLGTRVPNDYCLFIDRYGAGTINAWINVFSPFTGDPFTNLLVQIPETLSTLSRLKAEYPHLVPFPLYFEPGGFLPWGSSLDGDTFGWLTKGEQGRWKTALLPKHGETVEIFDLSFSEFLVKVLTNKLSPDCIPDDIANAKQTFEPRD